MKEYDTETLYRIEALRIKNWIGPKPNANPHIAIYPLRLDCSEVGFTILKEKE